MAGQALPSNLSYSVAYLASVGEAMSLGGVRSMYVSELEKPRFRCVQ